MQTLEPGRVAPLEGLDTFEESEAPVPGSRRPPAILILVGVAVAVGALLPAVYLVVRGSEAGLAGIWEISTGTRALGLLARTTSLAIAVTAAALAIGVPLAWLTVRSDLPGRRVWVVLTALPLAIPSFIGGYTFVAALGPKGLVQGWLEPLGVDRLPSIYGFGGAWLVLTLFTYPYVLLTARAALRRLDPAIEDASRSLGRGEWATFFSVVVPQLRPAMASGGLLVALYTLSDFGAVSLLRFDSFTRAIFVQYQASFDRTPAAVLSMMLVVLTAVILAAEMRTRGRGRYHRVHGSAQAMPRVTRLGRWRWPALALCVGLVAFGLVLPIGVAVYWLARGMAAGESFSLTWSAAQHSVEASAMGALVAVVAAWPVAVLAVRHRGRLASIVEGSSHVGFALPGVVVALSLVFFGARFVPGIYQTRGMLVFAYAVLFLPVAIGALRASLLQLGPGLEEASRSLGAGRFETWRRVVAPLVRPGLVAGFALVFLTAMKELPATLLLAPIGYDTLATQVWSATNSVFFARAAAPALVLVALSSVPLAVLVLRDR